MIVTNRVVLIFARAPTPVRLHLDGPKLRIWQQRENKYEIIKKNLKSKIKASAVHYS